MKPLFLLFIGTLFFAPLQAQDYKKLVSKAESFYQAKQYKSSQQAYAEAFKLEKKNPNDLYDAACSASMAGDINTAFDWLNLAMTNGWANVTHLKKDSDLHSLRTDKRWNPLVSEMQKKTDQLEASYDKPLRDELLVVFEDDQDIRQQFIQAVKKLNYNHPKVDSLRKVMRTKDSVNLKKVTKILDERGWVGKDKIGNQANQTLFLVIQHADLKTQQKYLPLMREAVKNSNAEASSLALLEDRVALGEGKKQIYGSQIGRNNQTNKYYVLPLDDPDNVDQRRAQMGLGSMADYVKGWDLVWNPTTYKKELPEIEKWSKRQ